MNPYRLISAWSCGIVHFSKSVDIFSFKEVSTHFGLVREKGPASPALVEYLAATVGGIAGEGGDEVMLIMEWSLPLSRVERRDIVFSDLVGVDFEEAIKPLQRR